VDGYFLDLAQVQPGEAVVRVEDTPEGPGWRWFRAPSAVFSASSLDEVDAALTAASSFAETWWVAGFISYEAGPALNPACAAIDIDSLRTWPCESTVPLVWFGGYDVPPLFFRELAPEYSPVDVGEVRPDWDPENYRLGFENVKQALARGESYQVNLTFRERFGLGSRTVAEFFASRCGTQPPAFATFIHGGDWQVASFSPELFFERQGTRIACEPMKGTAVAPTDRRETAEVAARLRMDPKSIAENIMIVDMVRNDLGSICATGSVVTPSLLEVTRHRRLLQMTSRVEGETSASSADVFRALFPAASITGAPKVATSRLIRDIETSPRGVYCGAIGFMEPDWQRFSVAIRTASIGSGIGEYGVGGGVVWDSEVESEYRECLAKNDFLLGASPQWEIVEAPGAHHLLDPERLEGHLSRLARHAEEFGVAVDWAALRSRLAQEAPAPPEERVKVRVGVRRDGSFEVRRVRSELPEGTLRARIARSPVSSRDPNLRVKTNSRAVLDAHLDRHPDVDEVLLYNEAGLVTEFCRGNVVIHVGHARLTPRPEAGCLAGLELEHWVRKGFVRHAEIPIELVRQADYVFLLNSAVGIVSVQLVD